MKWLMVSIFRLASDLNMDKCFEKMTFSLGITLKKQDNCIIVGDFNIYMDEPDSPTLAPLNNFYDTFDLANMTHEKSCFSKNHSSKIDLTLSHKPDSFQLSCPTETGLMS